MDRKRVDVDTRCVSSVFVTLDPESVKSSSVVLKNSRPVRLSGFVSDHCKDFGAKRKSSDQDLVAFSLRGLPFLRSSIRRFFGRGSLAKSGGKRWSGIGVKLTSSRRKSSRTSLMVNAACIGPLRPTTWTCLILLAASDSSAYSV